MIHKNIKELQSKAVNASIVLFASVGVLLILFVFFRALTFGFNLAFFLQAIGVFFIVLAAIFKNKLSTNAKALALTLVTLLTVSTGMYSYGFLSSAKVYIVVLPIFTTFVVSYRKGIYSLIILFVIYTVIALLYITKTVEYTIDVEKYIANTRIWVVDISIILLMALGLMLVAHFFRKTILINYHQIEQQNSKLLDDDKKLKESEERYRKLVSSFPDIIMIHDLTGKIIYGNENLAKMTGITPENYASENKKAHIHPDDIDFVRKALEDLLNSDKTQSEIIENRFVTVWGNTLWFSGTMSKIYLNDILHIQIVSRDITERKSIELELAQHRSNLEKLVIEKTLDLEITNEELQATNEELFEKNTIINNQNEELKSTLQNLKQTQSKLLQAEKMASLGVLTSGVAHEINNPLNYIMGSYLALFDYFEQHQHTEQQLISMVLKSLKSGVDRVSMIVKSLNDFSRNNKNHDENCDIHLIIDNCILMVQNQLNQKIVLQKNLTPSNLIVLGNIGKLHQVVINIVQNAIQAIENEGKITITTSQIEHNAVIRFDDTGIGIEEENLSKITDPFFTTKDPGKGTGLGLSISYSIIKEHKGSLEFKSQPNKGTSVTITIPLKPN